MATEWYLRIGDKKHGPFSSSQLKQLAENGRVTALSQVRKGESGDWVLASKVKGLVATGDSELPSPKKANMDQVSPQAESATSKPLDETEKTKKWYLIKTDKEIGPVSVADLKKMSEWGTLGPNDLVRLAG